MFGCFLWHNEHATAASSRSFRLRRREICTHRAVDDWSLPASCGSSSEAASRASNFFQCAIPASGVIDASGSLRWRRPRRLQLAHHPCCCGVDRLMRGPRCFELGLRSRALPSAQLTYLLGGMQSAPTGARTRERHSRCSLHLVQRDAGRTTGCELAVVSLGRAGADGSLESSLSLSLDARSPPIASSGPQQFHRVARSHGRFAEGQLSNSARATYISIYTARPTHPRCAFGDIDALPIERAHFDAVMSVAIVALPAARPHMILIRVQWHFKLSDESDLRTLSSRTNSL
ncbi:hypothetical protein BD310DRAFT_927421 [Dichomitus squalens]|uniref:Uncharacterized protein n=1 Tax=Dichomitus squalens TaxID=114155 RepID=A0A4Q9PV28_9APHY|nr:hypothetical protein BD310DRAFT_927421 [Dichomitus squalens]